jgi:DNA-binding MarR family transcriptional regulator
MRKSSKPPLPPLDERISFLIHRISARVVLICNPYFRDYGIDLHNSRMLVILLENAQVRVGDLVTRMVLPQSTISHQLRQLEKRGLVKRKRASDDSRSVTVSLTKKGREMALMCNTLSTDVYHAMVAGMSNAELDLLRQQLRDIFERLDAFDSVQQNESDPLQIS